MNIGRMRERIKVKLQGLGRSTSTGAWVQEPAQYKTVWAQVKHLRGTERIAADQSLSEADTVFTIRYLENLDTTAQIEHKGQHYDVRSVSAIGVTRDGLEIVARLSNGH